MPALIEPTENGLYCAAGDFHIDPWRPARRALITHAHADHARGGSHRYYATPASLPILERRLGRNNDLQPLSYGETMMFGPVRVSLHPAGHILGSAQVRVEHDGEVWVASGDFKRDPDPTCEPFEPIPCDTFITEATFALPVYRWPPTREVAGQIMQWWRENESAGRTSVLFTYALGKAQRVLAELTTFTDRTVYLHGAVVPITDIYRNAGIHMLPTEPVSAGSRGDDFAGELIIAPPGAAGSPWMRRFRDPGTAFASGWMRIRGNRRRRGYERGFVLSDHADWPGLLRTFEECRAPRILTTHGRADELVRYLRERGIDAAPLATLYGSDPESD